MDLSQLQYFQTVARFENISQAATVLHISQPALSRAISRLEGEIGTKLFERDGNKIRLNSAGQRYLQRVDSAVLELENGMSEIRALSGQRFGTLSFSAFANGILSEPVIQYISRYPHVKVRHAIQSPQQMENSLELGDVDFGFSLDPILSPNITWTPMAEDELIVLVPSTHVLAGKSTIALKELEQEAIAVPDPSYGMSQMIQRFCFQAGFTPDFLYEGMDGNLMMELLKKRLCVLVLPASVHLWKIFSDRSAFENSVAPVKPPITVLKIVEPVCRFRYGVCAVKGKKLPPYVDEFLKLTEQYLDSWRKTLENVDWEGI